MRGILRATAILASGWAVTLAVGVANAKVMALVLGPAGVGVFAILLSLSRFAATMGGVGASVGVVRIGTAELARGDPHGFEATRRAAWVVSGIAAAVVCVAGLLFASDIARIVLGDARQSRAVAIVALAVPIMIASALQIALINAHQRVAQLARATSFGSIVGGLSGMAVVLLLGTEGIPWVVLSWAIGSWAASRWFLIRGAHSPGVRHRVVAGRARTLLFFGLPWSFSTVAGEAVQLAIPVLVLHQLGVSGAGLYRAASSIAIAYLGFLTVALVQEYYPRLAATDNGEALARLAAQQQRFLLLVASPIIFLTLAFAPLALRILYSAPFEAATGMLSWQVIGDLVRLPGLAIALTLLATGRSRTYFFAEGGAALVLLATTWIALARLGLDGVGVAYLATYSLYYPVVWMLSARRIRGLVGAQERRQAVVMAGLVVAGVLALALPMALPSPIRFVAAVVLPALLAAGCGLVAVVTLWPATAKRFIPCLGKRR